MRHLLVISLGVLGVYGLVGCSKLLNASVSIRPTSPAIAPMEAAAKGGSSVRRAVKDAIDPDAGKIDTTPKDTTVEAIQGQKPAPGLSARAAPFETTTWRVKATVESVTYMKDQDYYLVLKGDNGGSTVVEVPDPTLCKGSPLLSQITEARKAIEQRYHPTSTTKVVHDRATITGVGFLGWGKSRSGSGKKRAATGPQGARLMPGTGIDFSGSDAH